MANATVVIKEMNGAEGSQTYTTCSSTATSWFRVSDAHGSSSPSNKIPIPSAGINYSYWKSYLATVTVNGSSNTLDNWCFYVDDFSSWTTALGTSGDLKSGTGSGSTYGFTIANYDQAEGQSDSNGWAGKILTDHTQVTAVVVAPTTATQYSSAAITSTGSTKYFVMQVHVDTAANSAALGTLGAITAHIQYDES